MQKISDDACTLESCSSFYFYSGFLSIFFFWRGGVYLAWQYFGKNFSKNIIHFRSCMHNSTELLSSYLAKLY